MAGFMARCQHGREQGWNEGQCELEDGHAGPHKSRWDRQAEDKLNRNPTLDSIRRVVREEIARALNEAGLGKPST